MGACDEAFGVSLGETDPSVDIGTFLHVPNGRSESQLVL